MKRWYKAQNRGEWCIYYSTTDDTGRIYKNLLCECASEAMANQIMKLQVLVYVSYKIAEHPEQNRLEEIGLLIQKDIPKSFFIEMDEHINPTRK